ncbi:MAG TPA: metallophosphoesterase, partial [Novosphingobium sp.]|nr:metallophosphoesterase [Novosphingobium sp.]
MLIAQITDIHIGFDKGNPDEHNMVRLRAVVDHLVNGPNRPDLLLLTGDLTEDGAAEDYARLAEALAPCQFPVWPMTGNHDVRPALLEAFPHTPRSPDGFVHYELDHGELRVIVLDTLEPGRHGGGFCRARADWLAARLGEAPDRPTLVALHHPPFAAGIPWMDTDPREPWVARLATSLAGHGQVKGLVCGHLHRTILSHWEDLPVLVCPSTAPAVGLDLTPIDPDRPDQRKLITNEPPGYCLHWWNGGEVVTHFEYAGDYQTFARFDEKLQP